MSTILANCIFTRSLSLQGPPGPPGLPGPLGYPGEKVNLLHLASKDCFDGTFAWLKLFCFCPHAGRTWFTRAGRSRWAKGLGSGQMTLSLILCLQYVFFFKNPCVVCVQGPKGDMGERGHPGERGEKGEMGLSGPSVSPSQRHICQCKEFWVYSTTVSCCLLIRVWMDRRERKENAESMTTWWVFFTPIYQFTVKRWCIERRNW